MIKQAEANFEALIESTQDLIWAVDLDYRLTLLNSSLRQRFQDSYGVQLEVGMRIHDFLPPERAARWTLFYERALSEGPFHTDYLMRDGHTLALAFNPIVVDGETTGISIFGKDITERKQAEASLSALIESTEDLIWSVDLDNRLLTFNRAFQEAFETGFSIRPLEGMRPEDLLTPERAGFYPTLYKRALSEGPFRTDHILCDGRTLELAFNPVVVDGKMIGISVFGKDITQQKQAQANLSALIESTEDLIWSVDLDFRLTAYNQSVKKTLLRNRGVEVALGKTADQLLPPELAAHVNGLFQRALVEGPYRTEYTLLDGRILELALNPIVMDGNATGVSIFGKDISNRKMAEKELQEAEKKYRDIFDGAMEGIYQTSIEGRPIIVNPALARMLGYDSIKDFMATVGDVAHDIWLDPGERARLLPLIEKWGAIRDFESRFKRKDGTVIWISLNARKVLGPDGKTFIIEGFIEDITERKRAEIQLHNSEERYRNVFQSGPNTAVISRLSDGVIIDANQAFLESTGFERNEVIGRTVLDLGI